MAAVRCEHIGQGHKLSSQDSMATIVARAGEIFWFILSLALFLVMGPFSAPIVLIMLARLAMDEVPGSEPEPLETLMES